jgi:hypothetical protein
LFILFSFLLTCAHGCLLLIMFKVLSCWCSCEYKFFFLVLTIFKFVPF